MKTLPFFPLLALFAALGSASRLTAADYRAGVAKVDITPDHPIRLNGFGFRREESEGVNQRIWARALAVDTGDGSPAVLMTVDILGIPADVYDELAKRLAKAGVKKERLAATATHTHTAPMLRGANSTIFGTPIPKEHQANIDKYTPKFVDALEAVSLAALKDLKPAKLSWGVGKVTFAMNRRKRAVAPTDHDLPALFVRGADGKLRAVYLTYACHAVTLSHNKIGGDWPGYAAAAIEDTFPDAVALVAVGCGADQNPNSGVTGDKVDVAAAQGREVAAEVKRLSENFLAPIAGPLAAKVQTLELPLADPPTRQEWEEKAKRMDAVGHHARVNLARLDRGEKLPTKVDYPVQTWAFGDTLALVHLPGEVVVDYSTRLKSELDGRRLWPTAYANNNPCYIPSERILKEGGYEGGGAMIYYDLPTAFKPGLEDKIVSAVKEQIGKQFPAKFDPKKTGGTKPLSPQQSVAAIRTRRGLRVDLVAAEPLVADPVAIAFGPDGKLWVAEMTDYPSGMHGKFEPGGRVVSLEDQDGDGFFDKSAVLVDHLPMPTGVLPWRKGVLVCAAPDILYAEDTSGDGKADVVKKLYSGFGTQNFQARVNSLQYGLDGWVYGSCGLFGGDITCHVSGKVVKLGDRDFRIKPDTGEIEAATGRTQQGRARDDRGNWFGCDNTNLLWHYPLDDHYLRRNPHVAAPRSAVNVPAGPEPGRLYPIKTDAQRFELSGPPGSVTAACGVGVYRDDLLGAEYQGNAFTCETVNLVVHRRVLKPNGVTFTGLRAPDEAGSEFLASADNWCRPVQATTGPDGALWFADMYRYLIEHPMWIPPADLAKIDQRAGAGLGRIYRVRPEGKPLRPWAKLDQLDTAGSVAALDTPNGWQRDMATQLLLWRNDTAAVGALEKLFQTSSRDVTRLHALCTLDSLGQLKKGTVAAALGDAAPGVRQHALRLAEPHLAEPGIAAKVLKLADDADAQVRLQAAYTLGEWRDHCAAEALAALARRSARDPFTTSAVMSSLNADNLPTLAALVTERKSGGGPPQQLVRDLLATAAGVDGGRALPKLLEVVVKPDGNGYRPWQLAAAAGALDSLRRQGKGWDKLPDDTRQTLAPVIAFARAAVEKDDADEGTTLAAIPLLARDPTERAADVRRLTALLAPTRPAKAQGAALAALAQTADPSVPAALLAAWPQAGPSLRESIVGTLYSRAAWQPELIVALESGQVPAGQIDAPLRFRLVHHSDAAIRARAEKLFAGTNPDRRKVIADYEEALALAGDRARGKLVFAKSCAPCHVLEGVGSAVGPDLTALANKSPRYLLGEVLDPNRNLDSRYVEYHADLKDGRTVTGVLAAETATGLTLRGQQGKEETVLRSDLERLVGTAKSLMPEGLEKDLPKPAMADLLAYLTAAAEAPARRFPGNEPAEVAASDGTLTLPATKASLHGEQIVFEPHFQNVGYWSGPRDHAVWKVRLDSPASFDVYLDYACAADSAGNLLALDGAEPVLRAVVPATGGWDQYKLLKLGTVKLAAGADRLTVRPDGPITGALLDLRTVYLVPVGATPQEKAEAPKSATEAAKLILSESTPKDRREALAKEFAGQAAEVVRAMTADMPDDAKEEYRRIPWIWRVSIAAGRKNDATVLADLLDASLPKPGEPLKDWQAVVIGGGVINGLSLENVWPGRRIPELLKDRPEPAKRWEESLKQASAMAEAEKVPTGTRYDALRMIALRGWDVAGPGLTKYLPKSAHPELQMGAVSGLVDVERPEVAGLLLKALPDLADGNRKLAVAGLLRTPERANALLDGLEKGAVKPDWLTKEHRGGLLKHPNEVVRTRAAKALGSP